MALSTIFAAQILLISAIRISIWNFISLQYWQSFI